MIRLRRLCPVAVLLAVATSIGAQDAKTPNGAATPTVDQIIDRYIAAMGGRSTIEKITSRASLGKIEVPSMNLSGTVLIHEKAPDKLLQVVVINGNAFRQGFDGTNGWTDDPADGLRVLSGIQLAEAKRDADFFHPLHLGEIYPNMKVTGKEKVGDHDAYVIEGTAAGETVPDKMYFDVDNGMAVRLVSHRHTPDGEADVQEDFSDYHKVDGLELPFTIEQSGGSAEFTIHVIEIHHGVELDDSEFVQPQSEGNKVQ
jgi:zinc protease